MSLIASVLFIFLHLGKTSSPPKPQKVSSWVILEFKGVIDVILLTQINTSSLLMSLSKDSSFFFSVERPHFSNVLSILLTLPSSALQSPPTDAVNRPLQVYTRRPRPLTRPLTTIIFYSTVISCSDFTTARRSTYCNSEKVLSLLITHIMFINF